MPAFAAVRAIAWAQWRTSRNFFLRSGKGSILLSWITGIVWYLGWTGAAVGAYFLTSGRLPLPVLERALPPAIFFIFFFWQMFPIILASQGAFIDLRRLLAYPIPSGQLFLMEVVLRVTTGLEMLLLCTGLSIGLAVNPQVSRAALPAVVLFAAFNLLLASGIKSLLTLLFRKKGVREVVMFVMVGIMVAPQFLATDLGDDARRGFRGMQAVADYFRFFPWAATANLALGSRTAQSLAALLVWTGAAYLFARLQFARTLRTEDAGGWSGESASSKRESTLIDRIARFPTRLLSDPTAIIVEKDIRTLLRAPRFRLMFLMAASIGAVVWMPSAMRSRDGWVSQNYLALVSVYCVLVIGEVVYWNIFGFERSSAQQWFVMPLSFRQVLKAKNIVAAFCTFLLVLIGALIAVLLPVKLSAFQFLDAISMMAVLLLFLMGCGNLTSVYMPKPVDGNQSWKNSAGKAHLVLLIVFPLLQIPLLMALAARWATGVPWAFQGVMAVWLVIGLCFYYVATDAAAEAAEQRREEIVGRLSRNDGPVSITT